MKLRTRSLLLAAVLACCWDALPAQTLQADAPVEVQLKGPAWRDANRAYASYQAGRYEQAAVQADAAIRLRPDSVRLRLLLIYALQKAGRVADANRAVDAALEAGLDAPELKAAKANLNAVPAGARNTASAAYRKAFPIATRAYGEYNGKDYASSARDAESAIRIDPSQGAWALLWLDSLEAQGKLDDAVLAADAALALGAPNRTDLVARRQTLRRRMAVIPAQKGYQALIVNDPAAAVPFAREAVGLAPDVDSHRLLLVTSLMLDGRLAEAEAAASDALLQDDGNTVALAMRGYLRQRQLKTALANADFDAALGQDWLDDAQRRNLRLIAADAALAAGDPARALTLIRPLNARDQAVTARRREAMDARRAPESLTLANYPAPIQDCRDTPYGTSCELLPSDAAQAGGPGASAYAAYARQDYQEAIARARKAVGQDPKNPAMQRLLTTVLSAGTPAQQAEAAERLNAELAAHPDDAALLMQRGYLNQRRGQPDEAVADFRAARATGKAPSTVILDEGYAQAGAGDKRAAVGTFRQAIDLNDTDALPLTQQQRFDTRSTVAGLSREWGATASVAYRGSRPAGAGLGGAPITVPGDAVFGTAEVFWRPSNFLNTTTRVFEVYGRLSDTLANGNGSTPGQSVSDPCTGAPVNIDESVNNGLAGIPTATGALGLRFTPSTELGLTFGIERQFMVGSATRSGTLTPESPELRCRLSGRNPANPSAAALSAPMNAHFSSRAGNGGWLTYVTYGYYKGTMLRVDQPSWFTMEAYMQGGYSWQDMPSQFWLTDQTTGETTARTSGRYKRDQLFAAYEVRVGRSYRIDAVSDRLVLFPYVVVGGDIIDENDRVEVPGVTNGAIALQGNGKSWSMGAGLGVNFRYWFREDHYDAPRSYLDWSTQYRFNVGGGQADRSKGLFMTVTLSY
ncbi:tetratricopeptide repeat protein [Paraburkholderia sp. IMGN_8]|uniref:NfrA family protein n=1 Tax=Paraburkholderia sp. IMGN_8 TaxID=3136564 RepID=UPI0031015278